MQQRLAFPFLHSKCYNALWKNRCTYKTSKDITSKDRTTKDIRSQSQNVPAPKSPKYKTSKASKRPKPQNVPSLKTSQLQNVQNTKRPSLKTSQAPKRPKYKTSQASKRPKCPRIRVVQVIIFLFLIIFSVNRLHRLFAELYKGTLSRDIL
jgi:hypothetical protein